MSPQAFRARFFSSSIVLRLQSWIYHKVFWWANEPSENQPTHPPSFSLSSSLFYCVLAYSIQVSSPWRHDVVGPLSPLSSFLVPPFLFRCLFKNWDQIELEGAPATLASRSGCLSEKMCMPKNGYSILRSKNKKIKDSENATHLSSSIFVRPIIMRKLCRGIIPTDWLLSSGLSLPLCGTKGTLMRMSFIPHIRPRPH